MKGCLIHYLRWGDGTKPGLVLVHGGAAHAHWWSFLAPMLTRHYDVVALDLLGQATAAAARSTRARVWAEEVVAVIADARIVAPRSSWAKHGRTCRDSIVGVAPRRRPLGRHHRRRPQCTSPTPRARRAASARLPRNPKVYGTMDEAVARFRPSPPGPCDCGYILDHIARTSLRAVEGGSPWKFDPRVFLRSPRRIQGKRLTS